MPVSELTTLLQQAEHGDAQAAGRLWEVVYAELRRLAEQKMAREQPGQTLQATALVHEAWLRLGGDQPGPWRSRAHFFGAAAEAMRRILVDNARRKHALRHGGHAERVEFNAESLEFAAAMPDEQLLALHDALAAFAAHDAGKAELVKLHFFAGLTLVETAKVLEISEPTAKRYWAYARAWLFREITRRRDG